MEEDGFRSEELMDHEEQEEDAEDEFSEISNGETAVQEQIVVGSTEKDTMNNSIK